MKLIATPDEVGAVDGLAVDGLAVVEDVVGGLVVGISIAF